MKSCPVKTARNQIILCKSHPVNEITEITGHSSEESKAQYDLVEKNLSRREDFEIMAIEQIEQIEIET